MPDNMCNCLILFFFQAEDGIRDLTVTGVQTCALPISAAVGRGRTPSGPGAPSRGVRDAYALRVPSPSFVPSIGRATFSPCRSEERRVGKECRSRWSPYH